LSSYFDLDRTGNIYINSFCEFLKNPSLQKFNFFKVSQKVIANQIAEFITNSVKTNYNAMETLEKEFAIELHKAKYNVEPAEAPSKDLLVEERINAKLFQFKLKRQGIILTLWEIFTFFEAVNTS